MVRKGTLFSELSAAVFAGLLGQDPNAAARAANTAVTENALIPYNPTPVRYSQDKIGDIAAEVEALSEGVSKEEKIDKMQSSLEKRLPGLGLTNEEGKALATSLVNGISSADHQLSAEEINGVALRSYIDLRGKPVHVIALETVVDYIEDDIIFHANAGEELGSSLGTFFSDDEELAQSFGEVGRKFGIAVGVLGMIPNPASLTKKAIVEGVKQAAKKEIKDKTKKVAAKTATTSSAKKTGQAGAKTVKDQGGKPLLGKNPRMSTHRTSTDLEGGKATAKSIFRNQTKGKKIIEDKKNASNIRRHTQDKTQIRFKKDGKISLELPKRGTQKNGETIHF